MSTDKSAAAIREFAEKWCLRVIECMKDDDYIMHDPEGILSDLTALISEGYVSKEEHDKVIQQRDELLAALKKVRRASSLDSFNEIINAAIKNTEK